MTWIESTCTAAGLEIAPHDECTYRMGAAWTFGIGDQKDKSKLDAINALLDLIGWQSARTDPTGESSCNPTPHHTNAHQSGHSPKAQAHDSYAT